MRCLRDQGPCQLDAVLRVGIADTAPDADTLWDFREALIKADALDALIEGFDRAGFIQLLHGSLARGSFQRPASATKAARKRASSRKRSGWTCLRWRHKKGTNARRNVKYSKAKLRSDGSKPVDHVISTIGHKTPCPYRFPERHHSDPNRQVWAGYACRSAENAA